MWTLFVAGLAQLVEHLFCKQGVVGSRPTTSTTSTTSVLLPRWRVPFWSRSALFFPSFPLSCLLFCKPLKRFLSLF